MDDKDTPAATKLKQAIEKYGKDKLYNELPDSLKKTYKQASFYQKIARLKNCNFFTDSKLLYEVLKILGISFESLFENRDEDYKIAYYLNKINENIESLKTEQQLNSWFESNSKVKKTTQRTTPINKLNNVLSVWYILINLIPHYEQIFSLNEISEKLNFESNFLPILNPNISKLARDINLCLNCANYNIIDEHFVKLFKDYGSYDRPKLNKLFAIVENYKYYSPSLSLLGINYILISNLIRYFESFDKTPFQEGKIKDEQSDIIYKQVKLSLNTILKRFDNVIEFIDIRSNLYIYEGSKDARTDSMEQLIKTENFIYNILSFQIPLWQMYITSIENQILQQNEFQVKTIQSLQDKELLNLINELKKMDFRSADNKKKAINHLRFSINKLCTNSPFGYQLITPISKLQYERNMSDKLENDKLPAPSKDSIIHFENTILGYLERFKSYSITK